MNQPFQKLVPFVNKEKSEKTEDRQQIDQDVYKYEDSQSDEASRKWTNPPIVEQLEPDI
tara:strand:- start:572 stop:748 length:177 start_codon:yes stop_codon:yes gene_type:complete